MKRVTENWPRGDSAAIVLALARGVSAQQRDALKSAADALGVDHTN